MCCWYCNWNHFLEDIDLATLGGDCLYLRLLPSIVLSIISSANDVKKASESLSISFGGFQRPKTISSQNYIPKQIDRQIDFHLT